MAPNMEENTLATNIIKQIRNATRRKFSAAEKIRILLEGIRGKIPAWELFRIYGQHHIFSPGGKFRFAGLSMGLIFLSGILAGPGAAPGQNGLPAPPRFRLEGQVGLPNGGLVKKKLQVLGFEDSAPADGKEEGGGSQTSGKIDSASPVNPGKESPRDFYEYGEMEPLVFLQRAGDPRHCLITEASEGRFEIRDLSPGTYKLTFAIPGLGCMDKSVKIASWPADGDGRLKLDFDFEPIGVVIEPVERGKISEKAASVFEKGSLYFSRGNGEKAFGEFEKAVREDIHYAEAWEYMGIIRHLEGNREDAEKYFRKALEIDPNSYRALEYRGTILLLKEDFPGARALFERAVLIRPDDPFPRTQLGTVFYKMQELTRALDQLVKARALDPRHYSQPQIITAEVFRTLRDRESVTLELEDFLENFPDDPKVPAVRKVLDSIPWQ